jgi:uncharacterized low-complexity protein
MKKFAITAAAATALTLTMASGGTIHPGYSGSNDSGCW